jgi:hypothetical protein
METHDRRHGLRVMAAIRAATDFGLCPHRAAAIARRIDPRTHGFERFVDALWVAVLADA